MPDEDIAAKLQRMADIQTRFVAEQNARKARRSNPDAKTTRDLVMRVFLVVPCLAAGFALGYIAARDVSFAEQFDVAIPLTRIKYYIYGIMFMAGFTGLSAMRLAPIFSFAMFAVLVGFGVGTGIGMVYAEPGG